jgi:hypothetical protein
MQKHGAGGDGLKYYVVQFSAAAALDFWHRNLISKFPVPSRKNGQKRAELQGVAGDS